MYVLSHLNNRRFAVFQRFRMYGYVLAAAKLNIRHEIWNLQTVCVILLHLDLFLIRSFCFRSLEHI